MARSDQQLDQLIKDQLESFSTEHTPDWNYMQQKIDEADADLLFDEKIRASLTDLKMDAPQIQWDSFIAKRNRQIARRNKIISARLIESCLIIFLLWTLDHIGITNMINPSILVPATKQSFAQWTSKFSSNDPVAMVSTKEKTSGNASIELDKITNEPVTKGFNRKKVRSNGSIDEASLHKKIKKSVYRVPLKKSVISQITFSKPSSNQNKNEDLLKNNNSTFNSQSEKESNNTIESKSIQETINEGIPATDFNSNIDNQNSKIQDEQVPLLPVLNTDLALEDAADISRPVPTTLAVIKPVPAQKAVLLNVHSGLTLNTVLTPSISEFEERVVYSQLKPGVQAGVSIGFQSKKYMLESGLNYQLLSYQPYFTENIYIADSKSEIIKSYYHLRFNRSQSHLISIPVLIHGNILHGKRWNVSLKAGLALTASLKNNYVIDTLSISNYDPNSNAAIWFLGNAPVNAKDSKINARVNSKSNQGLLDGGEFGVNSYSSLILGLRYTHKIKSNINLFAEFEYSKMLGELGFGLNGDKIISTNLNAGISYRFGKR
jgi:hypothetical protein